MLAIDVELRNGVFVGSGSNDLAMTGQPTQAEWPPSPARLFSALVAAGGTGSDNRIGTDDSELCCLELLGTPEIFASEEDEVFFQQANTRYVPIDETHAKGKNKGGGVNQVSSVQNYPAREAQEFRGSASAVPRSPFVSYVWPGANLTTEEQAGLEMRVRRVGYFGGSKTPARLRLRTTAPSPDEERSRWFASPSGDVELAVPAPGVLAILNDAYDAWKSGSPVKRSHLPIPTAMYGTAQPSSRPTRFFSFSRPVNIRHSMRLAEAVRGALLTGLTALYGGTNISKLIHGHDLELGEDYLHVVPLPFVGREYADGNIRGVALIFPSDTPQELLNDLDVVAEELDRIWLTDRSGRTFVDTGIERSTKSSVKSAQPFSWGRPSREWKSVTPVVMERRRDGGPSLSDVETWVLRNGITTGLQYAWHGEPIVSGGWKFHPTEVFRRKDQRRPYGYLHIVFDEPVQGPIVVGRGRHHGMGLMLPSKVAAE